MSHIMPDTSVIKYAVKTPFDGWDGPSALILDASISSVRSDAERYLSSGDTLVSGPADEDPHTWEVAR